MRRATLLARLRERRTLRSPQPSLSTPDSAQCFVRLPAESVPAPSYALRDLLSSARYDRGGDDLRGRGLFLDVPAWTCQLFEVTSRRDRA